MAERTARSPECGAVSGLPLLLHLPNTNSFFGQITKQQKVIFITAQGWVWSEASKEPLPPKVMQVQSQRLKVNASLNFAPWGLAGLP